MMGSRHMELLWLRGRSAEEMSGEGGGQEQCGSPQCAFPSTRLSAATEWPGAAIFSRTYRFFNITLAPRTAAKRNQSDWRNG